MTENSKKLTQRIGRYFRHLAMAVLGLNPFREELEEARRKLEKSAENMSTLQQQYYAALENWEDGTRALEESERTKENLFEQLQESRKQAASLETLVENLRSRIAEKDADMEAAGQEFRQRMERMKGDYQQRIEEYNGKIEELQNKLSTKRSKSKNGRRTGNQEAETDA